MQPGLPSAALPPAWPSWPLDCCCVAVSGTIERIEKRSTMTTSIPTPDYTAIKGRQRQTWASGDYHVIASIIVPISERLCDTVELRAGERVLDVATGSGNSAIAAARRLCTVTGMD